VYGVIIGEVLIKRPNNGTPKLSIGEETGNRGNETNYFQGPLVSAGLCLDAVKQS
jgi:hypothetical protein